MSRISINVTSSFDRQRPFFRFYFLSTAPRKLRPTASSTSALLALEPDGLFIIASEKVKYKNNFTIISLHKLITSSYYTYNIHVHKKNSAAHIYLHVRQLTVSCLNQHDLHYFSMYAQLYSQCTQLYSVWAVGHRFQNIFRCFLLFALARPNLRRAGLRGRWRRRQHD